MALLGLDAGKPFEDFNQLINRISGSASSLIMTAEAEKPSPLTEEWHADIWEDYGNAGEDRVQSDLNKIAQAVEAMCKPILTAKSPVLSTVASG
jgi:hypothetical protein